MSGPMKHQTRVAVVLPAHDEARLIGRALEGIPAWVDDVVVVDDGSRDGTTQAARRAGDARVRVVRHPRNRGVGAALVTGYRVAFEGGAQVVVVMAGDAQMDPADLDALVAPAIAGQAEYVKGNRLSHPHLHQAMPPSRLWGNRVLTILTRWATGLAVTDSQCGYTALTRQGAERLDLERLWPGYGYPNDLLGMAAEAGLRIREVVVRPIYRDERSGVRLRHALLVIPALLARILVRRLLPGRRARPSLPPSADAPAAPRFDGP